MLLELQSSFIVIAYKKQQGLFQMSPFVFHEMKVTQVWKDIRMSK